MKNRQDVKVIWRNVASLSPLWQNVCRISLNILSPLAASDKLIQAEPKTHQPIISISSAVLTGLKCYALQYFLMATCPKLPLPIGIWNLIYSARSYSFAKYLETLYVAFWTAFTRPAITLPKMNRFGWNLKSCQPNVGGWPWQTLGAIHAIASMRGSQKMFFGQVNNVRFHRFPVGQFSQILHTTMSIPSVTVTKVCTSSEPLSLLSLLLLLQLSLFGFYEETCVTLLSTAGECWRIARRPSWRTWLHSTWNCSTDCVTVTVLTRCGHGIVVCEQCSGIEKRYKYDHSSRLRVCFSLFFWPVCFFWRGVNKQTYKPNITLHVR